MAFYRFASLADFNSWHNGIKLTLGYPFLSKDNQGVECLPMNTQYTSAVIDNGIVKAWIDDDLAANLEMTDAPIEVKSSRFR